MRPMLVLLLVVALAAGCLETPSDGARDDVPAVAAATFDRAGAPWVAEYSSGCGMCLGAGDFREPPEHFATFVFENGRVLLVEFNVDPNGDGLHVSPNVTYDPDELSGLLRVVPRAEGGVWVADVHTGRLADEGFPQALRDRWAPGGGDGSCADYGAHYAMDPADAPPKTESVVCPVEAGDPLHPFADAMHHVTEKVRALEDGGATPESRQKA